jgi:hypothetical protein
LHYERQKTPKTEILSETCLFFALKEKPHCSYAENRGSPSKPERIARLTNYASGEVFPGEKPGKKKSVIFSIFHHYYFGVLI